MEGGQEPFFRDAEYPGVSFFGSMYQQIISSEGGEVGSMDDIGILVSVPKGEKSW